VHQYTKQYQSVYLHITHKIVFIFTIIFKIRKDQFKILYI